MWFSCVALAIGTLMSVLPSAGLAATGSASPGGEADTNYRRFSLVVTVNGLPPGAGLMPLTMPIDFNQTLERSGSALDWVDERSLRLFRITHDRGQREQPYQFVSIAQPRLERNLLPDTVPGVSYLGEYAAGHAIRELKVAGELTWMALPGDGGPAEYRLEFGTLKTGRSVQVPFSPQNLRMFDGEGRSMPVRWFPKMQVRPKRPLESWLNILDQGQIVSSYHIGPVFGLTNPTPFRRPFFYPVNGPDGVSITEFGKPHDPTGSHAHHYSLWIAHANVAGKDFWSERGGLISHEQLEALEDGPVFCRVAQKTLWTDGPATLLHERREFTFYTAADDYRLIDVDLRLSPAGPDGVTLGKTSFGFLAARVAESMTVFDGGGEIVNANGDRNEQRAHLKRAPWIDQSGPISQQGWNGIALLDHPGNPNHPTGWHCRNDGWVGAAFNMDAAFALEPGKTLRLRYRIVLHRGNARDAQIEQRYLEYAAKPAVELDAVVHILSE